MKKLSLITLILISFISYSQNEVSLPFSNIDYNSMSIRPLNLSESDFSFRLYVNNGKSLDRIITLTYDSIKPLFVDDVIIEPIEIQGSIKYIGLLFDENNKKHFYNSEEIIPERLDTLVTIINNADLYSYQSRDPIPRSLHSPFSSYTIEIIKDKNYHTFKFSTQFPRPSNLESKYEDLEHLFFLIFPELKENIQVN